MNYIFTPSLEHIALVKTAVTWWNKDDIRDLMTNFNFSIRGGSRIDEWEKKVEDRVIEKIPQLPLPECLKKKLSRVVRPIGKQIFRWLEIHYENCCFCTKLPNEFVWTPQGKIDLKKTAEMLIKDENLDIARRYKLACLYCFENYVLEILNEMPDSSKKTLYAKDPLRKYDLIFLWTCNNNIKREVIKMGISMEEELLQRCLSRRYAFECAADKGNKAAIEYLLQRLTPEDRKESLVKAAGIVAKKRCDDYSHLTDFFKGFYTDVLCLLLSQMENDQQMEVIKRYPFEVLSCFLDWPWHRYFMETASRAWDFLSKRDYRRLLIIIPFYGDKDCDYRKLFGAFWKQSPIAHQRYVTDVWHTKDVMAGLIDIKDTENIKLILQKTTAETRKKIITGYTGCGICESLIVYGKWDILEFFVRECLSSEDEMTELKVRVRKHVTRFYWFCSTKSLEINAANFNKFFSIGDLWLQ